MTKETKNKILPFILAILVILLDQISKALVCHFIPMNSFGTQVLGDFLQLIHVRNNGVAFSFGANWPDALRRVAFSIIPIIVLGIVIRVYFKNNDFTKVQRWAICGIVGGGFGNIIDRVFRPAGVVDFIDVKWFGVESSPISLFRMTRWPTFNIADSAVVVCGIMLVISFLISIIKEQKEAKAARNNTGDNAAESNN